MKEIIYIAFSLVGNLEKCSGIAIKEREIRKEDK